METLKILNKYHIEDKNNNILNNYTWANTPDRSNFNLQQSIERFNTVELIHALTSMLGTGAITYIIKENFPKCVPICLDLKYHNSWEEIKNKYSDFNFFQIDFFKLEKELQPLNLDVLITFNTFRGWDNSVGPSTHQNYSKSQFSKWVKHNSKYFITDRGDVENYFELLPFESSFNNLKIAFSK